MQQGGQMMGGQMMQQPCSTNATASSTDATTCSGNASTDNPARVRIRTEVIILLRPHTTLCCMMGK